MTKKIEKEKKEEFLKLTETQKKLLIKLLIKYSLIEEDLKMKLKKYDGIIYFSWSFYFICLVMGLVFLLYRAYLISFIWLSISQISILITIIFMSEINRLIRGKD